MSDAVNSPSHYARGGFELWDVLDAWDLDRWSTQAAQYLFRAPYKGSEVEDLKKAVRFITHRIEQLEGAAGRPVTAKEIAAAREAITAQAADRLKARAPVERRIGGIPTDVSVFDAINRLQEPTRAAFRLRQLWPAGPLDLQNVMVPAAVEALVGVGEHAFAQQLVDASWVVVSFRGAQG